MPSATQASPYLRVRNQAQTALRQVQTEIRAREIELAAQREQEQKLQAFIGGRTNGATPKHNARQRTDWRAALSKLPKQFTAADVRKVRGLANKPPSEIFAAITRWIEAKLIKRKDRGIYERLG